MIAFLYRCAVLDVLTAPLRDVWFWDALLFFCMMRWETRWRRELQGQRDYWMKETMWWVDQSERWVRLWSPLVCALRPRHRCHDPECAKEPHDCHSPTCGKRKEQN